MAGRLLFVILMYSCHEIQVEARLPPTLIVDPAVITETDSVTLNCQTPSSVSVSQCYIYTVGRESPTILSCMKTLTGSELLIKTHQSSPAEVKVKCFYTVKQGQVDSPSPHSDTSSITIHNIVKKESGTISTRKPFTTTTDLSDRPDASQLKPAEDIVVKQTDVMLTMPPSTVTTGQTSPKPVTNGNSFLVTPPNSTSAETWTWKLVVAAACFGGVVFLGLALLCAKRRTGRCSRKRTRANVSDDLMCMKNLDHGGSLPAGNDEAYSVITSVPVADCPAGSQKRNRQESQNVDLDVYHVYATISEEPHPSALKDMVYSTLQAH